MGEFFRATIEDGVLKRLPFDPTDPKDPDIVIRRRIPKTKAEKTDFLIDEPFGYEHAEPRPGEESGVVEVAVPVNVEYSGSDLASIPNWFGWIAAKTGPNLPAALVHDVLVVKRNPDGTLKQDPVTGLDETPVNHWYRTSKTEDFRPAKDPYEGIGNRWGADRIFREGMRDVGVDLVRRWLMWAAVAMATLWEERAKGFARLVDLARLVVLGLLMLAATLAIPYLILDLFDVSWLPQGNEGSVAIDFRDVGLLTFAMTALGCLAVGIGGKERHQWAIGMLIPALAVLSWAAFATVVGGMLWSGLRRLLGVSVLEEKARQVGADSVTGDVLVEVTGSGLSPGTRVRLVGTDGEPRMAKIESIEPYEIKGSAPGGAIESDAEPARGPRRFRISLSHDMKIEPGDRLLVAEPLIRRN